MKLNAEFEQSSHNQEEQNLTAGDGQRISFFK